MRVCGVGRKFTSLKLANLFFLAQEKRKNFLFQHHQIRTRNKKPFFLLLPSTARENNGRTEKEINVASDIIKFVQLSALELKFNAFILSQRNW
jgi:hypothetical protein